MHVDYFYEVDSYSLNRDARLCWPLHCRLVHYTRKLLPGLNSEPEGINNEDWEIANNIIAKIKKIEANVDWQQNLHETSYAVFDTETTGLTPLRGDKIISIGTVLIEEGKVNKEKIFDRLVNPMRFIPPITTEITGITDEIVGGKPTIYPVLRDFLEFAGSRILVAHNAAFDLSFLNLALCRLSRMRIPNPVIDTYLLSKIILPAIIDYSLESLTKKFGLKMEKRHTALGDSLMTAELFLCLLEILKEMEIYTLDQLTTYMLQQKIDLYKTSE